MTGLIASKRWSRAAILLAVTFGIIIAANLISRQVLGVFVHDQAEQVVYSQDWRLAYDEQMPVYQWVMNLLLRLTDYWVLTPDLLKYVWLVVAGIALYRLGRKMTDSPAGGALSVLLGFLIPTMNQDMLREYSHSAALLSLTCASSLYFIGRGGERPVLSKWSPGLSALWGLALLIRHAMAMFIVTQIAAWWAVYRPSREEWRPVLISAGVAALAALPVLIILYVHFSIVTEGTEEFMGEGSPLDRFTGLGDLLSSILAEGILLFLAAGIGYAFARRKDGQRFDQNTRFLLTVNIFMVGIFFLAVMVTNATVVRDRWLSPGLVLLAPVTARWFVMGLRERTASILIVCLAGLLTFIGVQRAAEPFLNHWSGKVEDENLPLRAIAREVGARTGEGNVVVVQNPEVAATLKLYRSDLVVYSPLSVENMPGDISEVWLVTSEKQTRVPLDFPDETWRCEEQAILGLPYRLVPEGRFTVEIARCQRL